MPATATQIAQALIRCRSVTPEDGGALELVRGLLASAGFETWPVAFASPGSPEIGNLYARLGTGAPRLAFAGHTDVVPPGDAAKWRHGPFEAVIEDGKLFGRGACDMKGGLAASLAAAINFAARGPFKGAISFLVTGDEEGPAIDGTAKLLAWALARGERFDHCILGEPTSVTTLGDTMKIGRRGSLTGRLTLLGKQGHVAYPHLAGNPIRALAPILDALHAPLDAGTADFDASNLEVVSVDVGNPASNVIPGEARLVFNVRFNDSWTPEALSAEIERRVAGAASAQAYDLRFDPCNATAFLTPRGAFTDLLGDAVFEVTGRRPKLSTSGGTSDARFINGACPVVELGLVGRSMHGIDECAAVADIEALAKVYERAMATYFGGGATLG